MSFQQLFIPRLPLVGCEQHSYRGLGDLVALHCTFEQWPGLSLTKYTIVPRHINLAICDSYGLSCHVSCYDLRPLHSLDGTCEDLRDDRGCGDSDSPPLLHISDSAQLRYECTQKPSSQSRRP